MIDILLERMYEFLNNGMHHSCLDVIRKLIQIDKRYSFVYYKNAAYIYYLLKDKDKMMVCLNKMNELRDRQNEIDLQSF